MKTEKSQLLASDLYHSAAVWLQNEEPLRGLRLLDSLKINSSKIKYDISPHALENLYGLLYTKIRKPELALPYFRRACHEPSAEAHSNLSFCHSMLHNPGKAEEEALAGLAIDPKSEDCMAKLTHALHLQGRAAEALPYQMKMVEMNPKYPPYWNGSSTCQLLLSGNFDYLPVGEPRALGPILTQYHNRILGYHDQVPESYCGDSKAFEGASVNVILEQGLGDCAMMIPYIKKLSRIAKRVRILSLRDHDHAIQLYRDLGWADVTVDLISSLNGQGMWEAANAPAFGNLNVWMMDLFNLGKPRDVVTLNFRPKMAKLIPEAMGKIGICWRGNLKHQNDWWRSMRFDDIKEFIVKHNSRLFCLQSDLTEEESQFLQEHKVEINPDLLHNEVVVGAMLGMDHVVTVDTFISHLAGILDIPCSTLIPPNVDWRWGLRDNRSVFYRSHEIVRQKHCGEWKEVLERVKI